MIFKGILLLVLILILVNQNQIPNQIPNHNINRVAGGSNLPTINPITMPEYNGVTTDSSKTKITIKDSTGINPYSVETLLHQTYNSLECQSNSGYEHDQWTKIKPDGSVSCPINSESLIKSTTTSSCIYGTDTPNCNVDRSGGGSNYNTHNTNRKKGLPCNTHTDCHNFYTMICKDNQCSSPFMDSRKFMDFPNTRFATNSPVRRKSDP